MCSVPMPAIFTVSFSHLLDCFICYIFYYSNNYLAPKMKKKKGNRPVGRLFGLLSLNSIETAKDQNATELWEP